MSDRAAILARRRRLLAAALAAVGSAACGPGPARPGETAARGPAGPTRVQGVGGPGQSGSSPAPTAPSPSPGEPTPLPGPGAIDADGDGVPDSRDACPNVAGVEGVDSMNAGCPPRPCLTIVPRGEIQFQARIYFDSGESRLRPESGPVLDEVARALADHDEIELEVVGSTDGLEPVGLALGRAIAVRNALISRGVSPARLSTSAQTGSGLRSTSDRAESRRVELVRRGPKTPLGAP